MPILKLEDIINSDILDTFSGNIDENMLIYELVKYKDQFQLNEGLILTHPLYKTIGVLDRSGFYIGQTNGENRFYIQCEKNIDDIPKLFKMTNNLGWFPAEIRNAAGDKKLKYTADNLEKMLDTFSKIFILFEPKYDLELSLDDKRYLYHATKKNYLEKIKKQGLKPSTSSKLANHPERIYLAFTVSAAEKIARKFVNRISSIPKLSNISALDYQTGIILKIDTKLIPSYFRIFSDPNYKNDGCYTLNTIPWDCMSILKEIDVDY